MNHLLILVAGMPGAGKTRFADYLSARLNIPLICKDRLKEVLWDALHYDTTVRAESRKYGGLAYDLAFHFCQALMKAGGPVILESNFTEPCPDVLKEMVERYRYRVITVRFGGDLRVIHKRFLERDATEERHPGLVSNAYFSDFDLFQEATRPCREFSYGDLLIQVDATDFSKVSYEKLTEEILSGQEK